MTTITAPLRTKPRVIVTTDPELDDLNSMLRMLLHANEIDLVGLVYSASEPHHKGNPELGISPHRWPAEGEILHIDQAINAYEKAYPNLRVHDSRYPTADALRALVAMGNVDEVGDMREPTPGSDLIVRELLADDPRPLFLQAWGGLNTIARALLSVEEEYGAAPDWEDIRARIIATTVLTSFGEQDSTLREYIRPHWPGMEHREVATTTWGYFARATVRAGAETLGAKWLAENVTSVGPIGGAYRVWGDGVQMADGFDAEDYFGLDGVSEEELRERGYMVWAPLQEKGSWISEGDSSNFALLVDNGLRNWEHPGYGGWGSLLWADPKVPGRWHSELNLGEVFAEDADNFNPGEMVAKMAADPEPERHVAMWWPAIQSEFAARLRWSVTERYEDANHPPQLRVDGGLDREIAPGGSVELQVSALDPDGDEVSLRWWQYVEAGTCLAPVEVQDLGDGRCRVSVGGEAEVGSTIHILAEGADSGVPSFTRWARIILTVN
ncbi:MAG: DUF1593 domain-containing protein [Actinomycetaceae bacterium]|nr:DUF1593 domain-containing protein [Actinomycetaceae bacterium]